MATSVTSDESSTGEIDAAEEMLDMFSSAFATEHLESLVNVDDELSLAAVIFATQSVSSGYGNPIFVPEANNKWKQK
jgi:hypothetical protein